MKVKFLTRGASAALSLALLFCCSCLKNNKGIEVPIKSPSVQGQEASRDASAVGRGLLVQGEDSLTGIIAVISLGASVLAIPLGGMFYLYVLRYWRVGREVAKNPVDSSRPRQ